MNQNTTRNAFVVTAVALFVAMAFCAPALADADICCRAIGRPTCVEAANYCGDTNPDDCPPGYICDPYVANCTGSLGCCDLPGLGCRFVDPACCVGLGGQHSTCCNPIRHISLEDDGEAEGLAPGEDLSPDEESETQASDQGRKLWPLGLASILILPAIPIIRRRRLR